MTFSVDCAQSPHNFATIGLFHVQRLTSEEIDADTQTIIIFPEGA